MVDGKLTDGEEAGDEHSGPGPAGGSLGKCVDGLSYLA